MERLEVSRFYAKSFDEKEIEFIVYDDNTMACPNLNIESFKKIELKPRFRLAGDNLNYTYNVPANDSEKSMLIQEYDIDKNLFEYLKENEMIKYSTDMAYFYGFEDKSGYDSKIGHYGVGSPYKWAKKKGPILVKQRKGQFN